MKLKEKLLLEEPEDELPPAVPEEPIVVSTEPEEGEPSEEIVKNALSSLVMDEISNVYDDIGRVNSIIATFADEGARAETIDSLNEIVDDLTLVVGKLHGVLAKIDPETGELIYDGMRGEEEIEERITRGDRRLTKETNRHAR